MFDTHTHTHIYIYTYIYIYISDHKTVCVDFNLPKPSVYKVTFSYYPINKTNFIEFNQNYINLNYFKS